MLLHIALLAAVPYLVGGCIPMKPPTPGIPAVKSCKMFAVDIAGCTERWGFCDSPDPLSSSTTIMCPPAAPTLYMFPAGLPNDGVTYSKAVCDANTGLWTGTLFQGTETVPAELTNFGCISI